MSKRSPFDYVKSINTQSGVIDDMSGYLPFLINRSFAMHMDTIIFAEEMNKFHDLPPRLQYLYYYVMVTPRRRFAKTPKMEDPPFLKEIMEYYQYSKEKALQALNILTPDQVQDIITTMDTGGK